MAATRLLWLALTEPVWETKFIHLWIAMEALFGPKNRSSIKYHLSTRIATFLNKADHEAAEIACEIVRQGYKFRSEAVHGGRLPTLNRDNAADLMLKAEALLFTTLPMILRSRTLVDTFCGPNRERYLNEISSDFRRLHPPQRIQCLEG